MKDCFSCPQPSDAPMVDDCPVVHLSDSAEDIDKLCALLYGVYHLNSESVDTSYLAMMMRIGRKYEIASLTSTALNYMQHLFPSTLQEWDNRQGEVSRLSDNQDNAFIFDIINLAYESHVPSILPAAFLSLWRNYTIESILSGIQRRKDGQPLVTILGPQAMHDCLRGRMTFLPDFLHRVAGHLEKPGEYGYPFREYQIPDYGCEDICSKIFPDLLVLLLELAKNESFQFHQGIDEIWTDSEEPCKPPLCTECKYQLDSAFDNGRNEAWEGLPILLQLDQTFKVS
ncbi:hypothetical protein HYPSUDRAFT_63873 [Hypholoma sublateritium FD-334 SS-4]|uniref:BTB domain-containing protein n=1 Tax=Hypholoma sublateritium (strain FD-334 SS-4) TaxID=945553 RepID=A0A0D2PDQ5_HYPSF|nr:hypothetical protein HYPSUDRAFT_63873 [Hypholoma sublateritium FD-334 SS-4]